MIEPPAASDRSLFRIMGLVIAGVVLVTAVTVGSQSGTALDELTTLQFRHGHDRVPFKPLLRREPPCGLPGKIRSGRCC